MAELAPLEEKLGEVLGLALAAQDATTKVGKMEGADDFRGQLDQMRDDAVETERRSDELVSGIEGKKTAIHEKARETKREAVEMMETYLGDEVEALDGYEFLSMAEAGELCHWEIVQTMAQTVGDGAVRDLADWAVPVQRRHVEGVRRPSLELAAEEARG